MHTLCFSVGLFTVYGPLMRILQFLCLSTHQYISTIFYMLYVSMDCKMGPLSLFVVYHCKVYFCRVCYNTKQMTVVIWGYLNKTELSYRKLKFFGR